MRIARIIAANDEECWASQDPSGRLCALEGNLLSRFKATKREVEVTRWLPPVEPRAILCIGLNYRKHAEESGAPVPGDPVLFMKNPAAAVGHEEAIRIPTVCGDEVDYEGELAVVIGKTCRDVPRDRAMEYVFGYTIADDVSARIWQQKRGGTQWSRGKSFDTFAPMGPFIVTPDEIESPNALAIRTTLNGRVVQDSNTSDMIFDVPTLVSFLAQDTTLLPGTVILTGTPQGVGWARNPRRVLTPGDVVSVEIERLGRLTNPVRTS